jgi:polyhydroxyalkanoate synthesis regulator phasin
MSDRPDLEEILDYLVRTSRLTRAEAVRVVDDVLTALNQTAEEFIRRRHHALQSQGYSNEEIFPRLRVELGQWRFRADELSVRQLRRIVYG